MRPMYPSRLSAELFAEIVKSYYEALTPNLSPVERRFALSEWSDKPDSALQRKRAQAQNGINGVARRGSVYAGFELELAGAERQPST